MDTVNYQRQLSVGAAQAYAKKWRAVTTPVNLARVATVELVFENVEQVEIPATAITELRVLPLPTTMTELAGFYLRVPVAATNFRAQLLAGSKPRLTAGRQRLATYQDVTAIIFQTEQTTRQYSVAWNPLSRMDQENLNQHIEVTDDEVVVWAWPTTTYLWRDILPAAATPLALAVMVDELMAHLPRQWTATAVRNRLEATLNELRSFTDLAKWTTTRHLVVTVVADKWTLALHDDADGQDYGGIEWCSYPELLGMSVTLPMDRFWAGLSWLLWGITRLGTEATTRTAQQQQVRRRLDVGQTTLPRLKHQATKMQRFLDAYVAAHSSEPDLATTVARFWPLTTVSRWQVAGPEASPVTPQLWTEFMAKFGAAYADFD